MILRIMKTVCPTFAFCIALSLMLLPTQCLADGYEIEIAPKVINLECGGDDFSVHTNIPYAAVDGDVCLGYEGCEVCCEVCSDKSISDARGQFVGKFEVEDVVNGLCLEVGSYRLVLSGTIGGEPFTAQQECQMECDDEEAEDDCEIECEEIKVIDNVNACASDDKGKIRSQIRKFLECMQENNN